MITSTLRSATAVVILSFASLALAQGPGRGDVREPGTSSGARDGSAPADGAITGGSTQKRERASEPGSAAPTDVRSERAISRCNELNGTLREQCLLQEQGAGTGGSTAPGPRTAPPGQNPR